MLGQIWKVCLSSGAGKKWHTCTMAQIWKCILNIYFLGRGMERYTCDLGTGRKWYTCILGTGMEGYACFLGQVRRGIPVQWHRYGRVYHTFIFLGQILKGIPAIWEQVGKGIPVFWGQVWKAIAGGQVRKVLPVFWLLYCTEDSFLDGLQAAMEAMEVEPRM
jgi:hypothetical protein